MKKIASFILMFLVLFIIGCSNNPVEGVVNISFSEQFLNNKIFVDDIIDTTQVDVIINYKNGTKENKSLFDLGINLLDTTESGDKNITVTYKNKTINLEYSVYNPEIISAQFSQTIKLYVGETATFASYSMVVLYENGKIETVSFDNCVLSNIDYSVDGEEKQLNVAYKGYTKQVSYVVTYREIEESFLYAIIDKTGVLDGEYVARVNNKILSIYSAEDLDNIYTTKQLTEGDFNTYTMSWISGGDFVSVILSLQNGSLVIDYPAQ